MVNLWVATMISAKKTTAILCRQRICKREKRGAGLCAFGQGLGLRGGAAGLCGTAREGGRDDWQLARVWPATLNRVG